ncbi:MAG: phosphate ABC transporter permease PstA [Oligoflexia bacterium]|nr:phosphate ABC transporter permease PstA [Oligoflexia bacterium]
MNYYTWRKAKNYFFHSLLSISAVLVLIPLFLVVAYVVYKGISGLSLDFFFNTPKPVGEVGGGMVHAIMGTLYLVALGSLIAVPIGVVCGTFLSEFGDGKIAKSLRVAIDLLTGVPSIVIGIFAYILIVIPFKGFSALAGGIALSLIILPIVTRSTEEILKLVPQHIKEAGLALGLPRWKVTYFIVVKGNLKAILTGVILAISRAAGETAPLLFTAFGNRYVSTELLSPMASLPVQIYNYSISPFDDWQAQAWTGAFVLIFLILGINLTCRTFLNRKKILEKVTRQK